MKKILKSYWYVFIILACLFLVYFICNSSTNEEIEVVSEYKEEESIVKVEEKEEDQTCFVDIKGEVKKAGVYKINCDARVINVITEAGGLTKNADTSLINLSKKVFDEMNIKIYSKTEVKNAKDALKKEPEVIEIIKEVEKECDCPVVENVCDNKNDAVIKGEINEEIKIENNNSNNEEIKNENNNSNTEEKQDDKKEENSNKLVNLNTATKEELMSISGIGESKAKNIIEYRNKNKFTKIEDILNVSGIGESVFEKIKEYITV